MNLRKRFFIPLISVIFYIAIFGFFNHTLAGATNTLIFSDNFNALTTGNLSGQNGWVAASTSTAWTVTATTTGNYIVGGNSAFNTSVVTQTGFTSQDTRLVVDFLAPASGHNGIHAWLRRTGTASSNAGYDLFDYLGGSLYLDYIDGNVITSFTHVAVSLTPGSWYTLEFEAVNDGSGNPVLNGWIYPQGTGRPTSTNITYTDTSKNLPNAGYVGLGGYNGTVTADNVLVYTGDANGSLSAPLGLYAVASSTQISLSWSPPSSNGGSPITNYAIEYRTGSNPFATLNNGVSTSTSATVTGLVTSTPYDFEVFAVNSYSTSTAATVSATTTSGSDTISTTPTLIAHVTATSTNTAITTAMNTTGATLLVATVSVYGASAASVSVADSGGNTWHSLADHAGTTNLHTAIWYAYDKSGSALVAPTNDTLTVTATNRFPAVDFSAWSGTLSNGNPFDVQNGNGSNGTSIATNNVSPSENNELIISSFGSDAAGTYTINNFFNVLDSLNFTTANNMGNAAAYLAQSNAVTAGATWSTTGTGNLATAIASFEANSTTTNETAPGPPTGLSAIANNTQVSLSWIIPENTGGLPLTNYAIEYRTGSNPFATFNNGVSTSTSATVTGLVTSTPYDFEVFAVNSYSTSTAATVSATTTYKNIIITSPARNVAASSTVATIGINRTECNETFYIPYIQTSPSLTVAASVDNSALPSGGGVKFILMDARSNQQVLYDMSAPFSVTFTGLAKGTYTLDTYIVDASQVIQSGSENHDTAVDIGIGDIYVAIGDSVTEGYDGTAYDAPPYTDWTNVPVESNDNRNYPQCGISTGYYEDHWQKVGDQIAMNNELENYYGYPIFILNEGVAGITSSGYVTRMGLATWQNRINALDPNKWLLHLGINDKNGSSGFQSNMQTIINSLINTYHATSTNIFLAVPSAPDTGSWQPYINNLISINNLTAGPNFNTYYTNHWNDIPTLYVEPHPTVAGHVQMARLWSMSIISPQNVSASAISSSIKVTWGDLSTVESTIAGYNLYYGTSTTALNTEVNVGNATSTMVASGLQSGQTYYFSAQGYDNDPYSPNVTALSLPASVSFSSSPTFTYYLSPSGRNVANGTSSASAWATMSYLMSSPAVVVPTAVVTSTTKVTFVQNVKITPDVNSDIFVPANTTMTTASSSDFTSIVATTTVLTTNLPLNSGVLGAIQYGFATSSISLSQPITITFSVNASYNGQTLPVYQSEDGGTTWTALTTCTVSGGICSFATSNLSSFAVTSPASSSSSSSSPSVTYSGGSSSYGLSIDNGVLMTATPNVTLSLYGTGAYTMEVSNTPNFSGAVWIPYATTLPWMLIPNVGVQDVYAQFKSVAGVILGAVQGSINLVPTVQSAPTTGMTISQMENLLSSLMSELQALEKKAGIGDVFVGASSPTFAFTRNLEIYDTGADVNVLQKYLIQENMGPAARALRTNGTTKTFGMLTLNALIEFQKAEGITPAMGYFGPITRKWVRGY